MTTRPSPRRPRFSVVIPVHDRADLIGDAIASVRAQTTPAAEIVVIDDGSSDGSGAIAERAGCRVVRETGAGPSGARNRGLREASEEWVAFLDSDDEWLPDHLQVLSDSVPGHVLVSTAALATDGVLIGSQSTRPLEIRGADRLLWPDNPVVTSAAAVDRALALRAGGFDESLRHSEDLDLWARLLDHGSAIVLPQVTVRYRTHQGQLSRDVEAMRVGTARLLGGVSGRTRRALLVRDRWDGLRAAGRVDVDALAWFSPPWRALTLLRVLIHRARGRRNAGLLARPDIERGTAKS